MAATRSVPHLQPATSTEAVIMCLLAQHAEGVCKEAGCEFVGIQEPIQQGDLGRALILFAGACRTTLALDLADFNLHAVKVKLQSAHHKWAEAAAAQRAAMPAEDDIEMLRRLR